MTGVSAGGLPAVPGGADGLRAAAGSSPGSPGRTGCPKLPNWEGGTLVWDDARSDDDRDIGWGDDRDTSEEGADTDIEWLRAERPPHHIDRDTS
ncbi:hypothetical protein [Frankia sp. Cr2]|uniref:hypothetical protein n=1 Tax=Frankia sp. Cr2 TaxID=3073932 RepID=UPI002AD30147|nr:hypothetical protein [Frankia sp. Cr2]